MAGPYSLDLRERVVAAAGAGLTCREVAAMFSIGAATVVRWVKRSRETGSPAALPKGAASAPSRLPSTAIGCSGVWPKGPTSPWRS